METRAGSGAFSLDPRHQFLYVSAGSLSFLFSRKTLDRSYERIFVPFVSSWSSFHTTSVPEGGHDARLKEDMHER
jgi:hypothetical protein